MRIAALVRRNRNIPVEHAIRGNQDGREPVQPQKEVACWVIFCPSIDRQLSLFQVKLLLTPNTQNSLKPSPQPF